MAGIPWSLQCPPVIIHKPAFPIGHRAKPARAVIKIKVIFNIGRPHLGHGILAFLKSLNMILGIDVVVFPK